MENQTPKISVVLTTYNRADRLKKAIQSVIDQSFQDWELIVVDDASPDHTEKVVRKFMEKDKRIFYIRRKENWGCHSRPKNDGIKAARTELIAFLDDDNVYLKDHLQALYKTKEENPHVKMVFGDRWIIDDSNSVGLKGMFGQSKKALGINALQIEMQMGLPHDEDGWHPAVLDIKNYIDTSDVLMDKQVLYELGGWDESLKKFADWNLWVRFAKAGYRGKHVPLVLTEYHMHAGMAQLRFKSLIDQDGRILPTFEPHACKIFAKETTLCEPRKLKVCVLTVAWHRLEYTKRTVQTMREKAGYDFDHIIFFQEKTKEEGDWAHGKFKVILDSEKNEGVPYAYNVMLKSMEDIEQKENFKYDIVVLTDNDCEFKTDNWLAETVDLFERQQKLIVAPYPEGLRDNPGGAPRVGWREFGIPERGYVGNHFLGFPRIQGNLCQAFPRRFFEGFKFNVDTFLHGTQSMQVANNSFSRGFILAYMENVYVEHMDTTTGQEQKFPEEFKKSQLAKTQKYGTANSSDRPDDSAQDQAAEGHSEK